MPATATIVIEVDDQAAVQSVRRLGDTTQTLDPALQKVGQRGNVVLTDFTGRTQKAREATQLLSTTLGVQMPRSIERVIASSAGMQKALISAFSVAAPIAVGIFVIQQLIDTIDKVKATLDDFTQTALRKQMAADRVGREIFHETLKNVREAQAQTQIATAAAIGRIHIQLREKLRDINDQIQSQEILGNKKTVDELLKLRVATEAEAAAEIISIRRKMEDETKALQAQASEGFLTGLDLISAQEDEAISKLAETFARGEILSQDYEARLTAIQEIAESQRIKLSREAANAGQQAILQAEAGAAMGADRIEKERLAKLQQITQQELNLHIELAGQREALAIETEHQLTELRREAAEQTLQIEEDAAVALAPTWQRADAQIAADAQRRIRAVQQALADSVISERQAAIQISAVWQQTFAQMRDNLAGQLESLFDDITGGNIGKRFLSNFKKLIFEMIAAWMLGLRQMQSASAVSFGGGGLLGSLLGGVFGIGGFGGGAQMAGPGGTAPTFGNLFGGGGGLLAGIFGSPFGASSSSSSGGTFGALPTALGGSALSNLGLAPGPLSAGGGIGSATILPAGASAAIGGGKGFSGILSRLGPSLAGLQLMAGVGLFGLAGKVGPLGGAALGAVGGLLSTSALIAAFPALLGVLGAFTLGIGAVVGALLGALFGFGKSTKKARLQIEAQVKEQAQKIEDAYNAHQIDFNPAMDQLEQLRQQGVDALRKAGVKDISRSRVGHVDHWVDKAENEIKATEAERVRRMAIAFGPAQFRVGGFVSPSLARGYSADFAANALHFAGGGAVPAILHAGEYVMRPEAVDRIGRGNLEALNSGASAGAQIIIQAWDGESVERWLRNGGSAKIRRAIYRDGIEGRA